MRARMFVVALLYIASTVLVVSLPGPVATAGTRSLRVTPDTALADGVIVTIAGTGFAPSVDVGVCQGIVAGAPGIEDCGGIVGPFRTDGEGAFSTQLAVRRFLTVGGVTVDCASSVAGCWFGSAEADDIANTSVFAPISFLPVTGTPRPDLVFKRRDTQQLLEDNVYFPNLSSAPQHSHSTLADGTWAYALIVQNDGDVTDDLVLSAPIVPPPSFGMRIYYGPYELTAPITGGGLVIHGVAPGQSFLIGVHFNAPGVHDAGALTSIKLSSVSAPELVDYARLWVDAPAS